MLVQKISHNPYINNQISFKSNREHEAMLRALRAARAEEMKRRYAEIKALHDYRIQDQGCHNMAQFMLNFVCSIENDSEHNLNEFFASEIEAAKIRRNLSPKCQANSLEIRNEIQSQPVFRDPALALITAKDMKDFVPQDEEFASDQMFVDTINAAKRSFVQVVNEADKTKFNAEEIGMMKELTQIIEKSTGLDFGKEYDSLLEKLLNSIRSRKQEMERVAARQKVTVPNMLRKLKH